MSDLTRLAWTDCTWNPVRGCSRISEGCRNCYAERIAARMATNPKVPGMAGFAEMTPAGPRWTGRVALVPSKLEEPLRWRRPRKVFVNSMSDLFHTELGDMDILRVFGTMAQAPQHTFQVLTKRAKRMADWFHWVSQGRLGAGVNGTRLDPTIFPSWPLPNVWLGVSAEGQETLRKRAWQLLKTPAAVRFVSLEPLLEEVDLDEPELLCGTWRRGATIGTYLDWVILGGESGPGARPCEVSWIWKVAKQCFASKVPVFVKQLGSVPLVTACRQRHYEWGEGNFEAWGDEPSRLWRVKLFSRSGSCPTEWAENLRVREFPRGAA